MKSWFDMIIKSRRKLGLKILLLFPGIILYFVLFYIFERGSKLLVLFHKLDIIYIIVVFILILNAILLTFLDLYSKTEKNRSHPMKGIVQGAQVVLFFIGAILIVAILFDKSPSTLLTGLGASAAVLMLVFKDSILGFVAGVQLSANDMVRLGDWIQLPNGEANGIVQEISLNTVKILNWDNTISTIPPYTLANTSFRNWRGMQESGGRRADKSIKLDMMTLKFCQPDDLKRICSEVPLMEDYQPSKDEIPTNAQLYRIYIERYLNHHPEVNTSMDIIISQKEPTPYGVPIEVYFFTRNKAWKEHERIQSDIFDHLLVMTSAFDLKLYQYV